MALAVFEVKLKVARAIMQGGLVARPPSELKLKKNRMKIITFMCSCQGRIYVANEYATYARIILIVYQELKTSAEILLNSFQAINV